MKIAQFTNTVDGGGAETLMLSLTQQLLERNHEVEIHAFDDSWIIQRCKDLKLPHFTLRQSFKNYHSVYMLPVWGVKHGSVLKQRNIDVLHSHVYGATLRGAAAAAYAHITHVATQHDNHSVTDKMSRCRWLNVAGALGTKIVLISKQMMDVYVGYCVKEKYCSFVHNGVDGDKFKFNSRARVMIREQYGVSANTTLFVAPGRLQHIKGFDVLIKAVNKLKYKDFNLFILGEGPERTNLENMVKEYGLNKKVKFIGAVNNVEDFLSAADVFTLASRNEGLPCSIIEAMFASLPIVTTSVGGNKELVIDSKNGYTSPSENANTLANNLSMLINNHEGIRQHMAVESHNHARNFTLEKMTSNYLKLFEG